jgi:hypothetical protein
MHFLKRKSDKHNAAMGWMYSSYDAEYQENTYQQCNPDDCYIEVFHHRLPDYSAMHIALHRLQMLSQKELLILNTVGDIRFTRNELIYAKGSSTCLYQLKSMS